MLKRIFAITFILAATALAWVVLGSTIFARTYDKDSKLQSAVSSTWGTKQEQKPATAKYNETQPYSVVTQDDNGKKTTRTEQRTVTYELPLESTRADAAFDLDYRQKGLLWYSTYKVRFLGAYTFRNSSNREQNVAFRLPLPASRAIYDDVQVTVDGKPVDFEGGDSVDAHANVPPGQTVVFQVGYRSQGLDRWTYCFGGDVTRVRDFLLTMHTNFRAIDFPENTLSPTEKHQTAQGWDLTWRYGNLLSGYQIGMDMPQKLQPGPLAGQISYFAPVSLLFFFFLMFIITTLRGIELHPMNYFFLACAFFAFHLLLAYLVDHISIHVAFVICSAVSVALVISYLRLVVGMKFAAVEAGISQLIYLVLFSYAFFFQGFTGLAVTIGAIVTLFVVMQMTGRIKWADKFAASATPPRTNPLNGESWVKG